MGFRAREIDGKYYGIFESVCCEFVNPEYMHLKKEKLEEYAAEMPFPETEEYKFDDLIYDLTRSSGSLIIPGTREQADWVCDALTVIDW